MSARWYVREAESHVSGLRARLRQVDFELPIDGPVDLELMAQAYLDCDIIPYANLTDRKALSFLSNSRNISVDLHSAEDRGLAGALYVTENDQRFIFLEADDSPQRQRFSLAHEIGHLLLEAEPRTGHQDSFLAHRAERSGAVYKFGRCPQEYMESPPVALGDNQNSTLRARVRAHQARREKSKSEWRANFFAAEMLMPYEGVRQLLQSQTMGIQSQEDLARVAAMLSDIYKVSLASATLRLRKDLAIVPVRDSLNKDLFS